MNRGVSLNVARAAKTKASRIFHDLVGEVAVGLIPFGNDRYGLKVNLTTKPDAGVLLPAVVDGVPVRIEVVGTILKQ